MPVGGGLSSRDWARYWRADAVPVEAMHAHFTSRVYHRRTGGRSVERRPS